MRIPFTRSAEERERDETETRLVQERMERVMQSLRETLDEVERNMKEDISDGRI